LAVAIICKLRTYQINIKTKLTDLGGPLTSKVIQAASKAVHHSSLESSLKKGRIAFTALSAVVARSAMLSEVVDKGEVADIFVGAAKEEQELNKETLNIITD
jgi:hypothetical protein